MNEEEYLQTQEQIIMFANLVQDLPLQEFIAMGNRAQAVGPFLDPTLWIKALKS